VELEEKLQKEKELYEEEMNAYLEKAKKSCRSRPNK
jgi:hypothetical protein